MSRSEVGNGEIQLLEVLVKGDCALVWCVWGYFQCVGQQDGDWGEDGDRGDLREKEKKE